MQRGSIHLEKQLDRDTRKHEVGNTSNHQKTTFQKKKREIKKTENFKAFPRGSGGSLESKTGNQMAVKEGGWKLEEDRKKGVKGGRIT